MNPNAEEAIVSGGLKLKWKGLFDLDEVYKRMKFWLDFKGYGDEFSTFKEEKYVEKIKGQSKEIHVRWRAEKIISDYFSNVISVTFLILGLKEVELGGEKERKIKMHST
jgi:hypothetical protein